MTASNPRRPTAATLRSFDGPRASRSTHMQRCRAATCSGTARITTSSPARAAERHHSVHRGKTYQPPPGFGAFDIPSGSKRGIGPRLAGVWRYTRPGEHYAAYTTAPTAHQRPASCCGAASTTTIAAAIHFGVNKIGAFRSERTAVVRSTSRERRK
jgi:hypothetical protein